MQVPLSPPGSITLCFLGKLFQGLGECPRGSVSSRQWVRILGHSRESIVLQNTAFVCDRSCAPFKTMHLTDDFFSQRPYSFPTPPKWETVALESERPDFNLGLSTFQLQPQERDYFQSQFTCKMELISIIEDNVS